MFICNVFTFKGRDKNCRKILKDGMRPPKLHTPGELKIQEYKELEARV